MALVASFTNQKSPMNSINYIRTFTTETGEELMLHELEPVNYDSGEASKQSWKSERRGRPRKDEDASLREEWKRQLKERKNKLQETRQERRERKRKLKQMQLQDRTPIKRGRPRKQNQRNDHVFGNSIHNDECYNSLLTPNSQPEEEEEPCTALKLITQEETPSTVEVTCNLVLKKREKKKIEQTEVIMKEPELYQWSPLQRLTQLNLSLAFTEMYKETAFWDRIVAEFISSTCILRLELGNEKVYELNALVISKFFWIWSQLGVHRIQMMFQKVSEQMIDNASSTLRQVSLISQDTFIYSCSGMNNESVVTQNTSQSIYFEENSKISKWTLKICSFDRFINTNSKLEEQEALVWGFPRKLLEFLNVALVMTTLLPDSTSWMAWFHTYYQQNIHTSSEQTSLNEVFEEFAFKPDCYDKEQEFIFEALNSPVETKDKQAESDDIAIGDIDNIIECSSLNPISTCGIETTPLPDFDLSQFSFEESMLLLSTACVSTDAMKSDANVNMDFITELDFMKYRNEHHEPEHTYGNINADYSMICDDHNFNVQEHESLQMDKEPPLDEFFESNCDEEDEALIIEIVQSGSASEYGNEDAEEDFFDNYS